LLDVSAKIGSFGLKTLRILAVFPLKVGVTIAFASTSAAVFTPDFDIIVPRFSVVSLAHEKHSL